MARFLLALLFSSCLGAMAAGPEATEPVSLQPSIEGAWVESVEPAIVMVPGFQPGETLELHGPTRTPITLQLHTAGSQVSGSGTYNMEAGPHGTLTVSGHYHAPELNLTLTSDLGQVSTYTAKVLDAGHIQGVRNYKEYGTFEVRLVRP